jgi:hypothetical protein
LDLVETIASRENLQVQNPFSCYLKVAPNPKYNVSIYFMDVDGCPL